MEPEEKVNFGEDFEKLMGHSCATNNEVLIFTTTYVLGKITGVATNFAHRKSTIRVHTNRPDWVHAVIFMGIIGTG